MQVIEAERSIGLSHPSLAGHFPGKPVVPGVVILDCVAQLLCEHDSSCRIRGIPAAKFVSPLLPEQLVHIVITLKTQSSAAFECSVGERTIAQGRIELQREAL